MAVVKAYKYLHEETGITGSSDEYILKPEAEISIAAALTAGSPATGAKVQFTISSEEDIENSSATWFDSDTGNSTVSFTEINRGPITGLRLSVTDGTWKLQIRQVIDEDERGR